MKTLHLTLRKAPFAVMVNGEKIFEYRIQTMWLAKRIVNKQYDIIRFKNGYSKDAPQFDVEYMGYHVADNDYSVKFSNGLEVNVKKGMIVISLGKILSTKNIK